MEGETVNFAGIRVTSIERTLFDLSRKYVAGVIADAIHEAEFCARVNRKRIDAIVRRNSHSRAAGVLREAVDMNDNGSGRIKSSLERKMSGRLKFYRAPAPHINSSVAIGGNSIEVDFLWPESNIAIEVDGHGHARKRTSREDQLRDMLLRTAGIQVIRCRPDEIDAVARRVSGILATKVRYR
jgi:very-short-patch-repair endonuclease